MIKRGRVGGGMRSHFMICAIFTLSGTVALNGYQYDGRMPPISASLPVQKYAAVLIPARSAVTQIGSPPNHEPSPAEVRRNASPRFGSKNELTTIPCSPGVSPVA